MQCLVQSLAPEELHVRLHIVYPWLVLRVSTDLEMHAMHIKHQHNQLAWLDQLPWMSKYHEKTFPTLPQQQVRTNYRRFHWYWLELDSTIQIMRPSSP